MFVNYKIATSLLTSGSTFINIPINLEYQLVDNSELIERVFVETETEKAINPILDYDKTRFLPINSNNIPVDTITYNINFLNQFNTMLIPTYYSDIEIDSADIKFRRNYFKESFLNLSFYDSDNPLTQNLITEIDIYSMLSANDFYPAGSLPPNIGGQPKPSTQIPVKFILSNPLNNRDGFFEGYHIYAYKDEYTMSGQPKSLYMKATYFNAKTGKSTNLMNEPSPYRIDSLINKLYTKYNLYRNNTGYYYYLDTTYSNNVSYTNNTNPNLVNLTIDLYQIQSI